MAIFRVLTILLIALALGAGGISPGFAGQVHPMADVIVEAPCHDGDGDSPLSDVDASLSGDCCDTGACRCDCLQHSAGSLLALRAVPPLSPARSLADVAPMSHVPVRSLPETRPPIA